MIRWAERDDRRACLRMAESFHKESPYSSLSFDRTKCSLLFDKYLEGDRTEIAFLLSGEDPYGMIIGLRGTLPFSSDVVCTELAWWVDHDKRKSRSSLMLFKAYEEWTRRVGSVMTQVAMLPDVTDLSSFYGKQGYAPAETSFVKELRNGSI
jgi:hypothetical protein